MFRYVIRALIPRHLEWSQQRWKQYLFSVVAGQAGIYGRALLRPKAKSAINMGSKILSNHGDCPLIKYCKWAPLTLYLVIRTYDKWLASKSICLSHSMENHKKILGAFIEWHYINWWDASLLFIQVVFFIYKHRYTCS